MSPTQTAIDAAFKLPVNERIELVRALWDSVAEEVNAGRTEFPLTEAQHAELECRMARDESGKLRLVSWEEVKRRRANPRE